MIDLKKEYATPFIYKDGSDEVTDNNGMMLFRAYDNHDAKVLCAALNAHMNMVEGDDNKEMCIHCCAAIDKADTTCTACGESQK
ncbi:hypothetical protein NVP1052A_61 [Vibrio phage 1.052.A._10N.286.46.C3]|nr:hypothetical protein NVP1052A_61 [Vibrio phage 1.052.A._10N.286.46.C3]